MARPRELALQGFAPALKGSRLKRIAPPDEGDATADLREGDDAQEQLPLVPQAKPLRKPRVSALAFAQLGNNVGVEQISLHDQSRSEGCSGRRAKSSSSPMSGMMRRDLRSGNSSSGSRRARRKIRRCSSSAETPCS